VIVDGNDAEHTLRELASLGERATAIGSVVSGDGEVRIHP